MRKELVFNNGHNNYSIHKYCFQKDKKPVNINKVDTKKILLSVTVKKVLINTILDM